MATASDEKWPHDVLMNNTVCIVCNRRYFNRWQSCNRRAAAVNLHPGLMGIRRQHIYMVKLFSKYQVNKHGVTVPFQGHPGAKTTIEVYTVVDRSLPQEQQNK